METGFNGLLQVLTITEKVSSACPQLQVAVGALLVVLKAYKRYAEAAEAIKSLVLRIEPLNEMLRKISSTSHGGPPQALQERLDAFAKEVQSVVDDANALWSRGRIARFVNAAEYTEKVNSWIERLCWHVHSFVLGGMMELELTVHEMAGELQHGFAEMGGRFDKVDEGIEGIRNTFDSSGTDAIPGLRYVPHARFEFGRSGRSTCAEGTRVEVLQKIYSWLRPETQAQEDLPDPLSDVDVEWDSDRPILWIHALAGAGKTTLAETVARRCHAEGILAASFFCARDGDRSDILCIIQNVASDLAEYWPQFHDALLAASKANPHIQVASASQQIKTLLVEPLHAAKAQGEPPKNLIVIVDALDECKDDSAESTLLQALSLHISLLAPLKFIITSRPVVNITRGFRALEDLRQNTQELPLDRVTPALTERDIITFLQRRFKEIGERYAAGADWVSREEVQRLAGLSERLFIYAATVASFVEDKTVRDPRRQLDILLRPDFGDSATLPSDPGLSQFVMLDKLYGQVLRAAFETPSPLLQARVKRVLGTIALAEERLSPSGLASLLGDASGPVWGIIDPLRPVLAIPSQDDVHRCIRIIHLSFADFLVDRKRCTDGAFYIHSPVQHSLIALRCLELMQSLKYNICEINSKHDRVLNNEVLDLPARIAQHISPALRYACKYWTRHLCRAEIGEDLLVMLEEFCKAHLLHWLEALSLMGCVDGAVDALQSVQVFLKALKGHSLRATEAPPLLYDCERVVRAFYPVISTSSLHMYSTVAIFAPLDSPLHHLAAEDARPSLAMRVGADQTWSSTLASRATGTSDIRAPAFSPDGMCIACGYRDGTIQLRNTHTGAQMQVLECHTDPVACVEFSPTGKELLSGSVDGTVYVHDVATGARLHGWKKHSDAVYSVAWSLDGVLAASASRDGTVRLWRVASPEKTVVLQHAPERHRVCDVVFAPDGDLLSGSGSECNIWDTRSISWDAGANITPIRTLAHDSDITAVAVSPDSRLVACGLDSGRIVLRNKSDGRQVRSLPGRSDVISLAFYPNNLLAAAYEYSPFTLWDVSTGAPVKAAVNNGADAAAFASDGLLIAHAVGSQVQIWVWPSEFKQAISLVGEVVQRCRLYTIAPRSTAHGLDRLSIVATSPTGKHVLAGYGDKLRIYEASTGRCMRVIRHDSSSVRNPTWSPMGNLFACTGKDGVVKVWKAETGERVGNFTGHSSETVTAVAFMPNEQHILFGSNDGEICKGRIGQNGKKTSSDVLSQSDGNKVDALAVSSDGQWILSAVRRRDSPPDPPSADLLAIPSRQPVEYRGWYCSLRLHDATGRVVWIEHHSFPITSVAFSEDCTRALAGNRTGEVFVYDLTQLTLPGRFVSRPSPPLAVPEWTLRPPSMGQIRHLSFTADCRGIITDGSHAPLSPEQRPLRIQPSPASPRFTAAYFYEDGWLWRIGPDSDPRQLSWIPPSFRHAVGQYYPPTSWSTHAHTIAIRTREGRLVILDASQC
ncbi:WD40 repeat-like protein [Cubamyces sp. BRFM 1775]|nr:WD40 repeat-like protein [Cubamyces sp. BRFM 1775]